MKKLLAILLFTILYMQTLPVSAIDIDDDNNMLYLYTKASTEAIVYSLDEINTITFDENGIKVWNTKWPTAYAYTNNPILSFKKRDSDILEISSSFLDSNIIKISFDSNKMILNIAGCNKPSKFYVYNLQGYLIVEESFSTSCHFSLTHIQRGFYYVQVVNRDGIVSKKIVIK